TRERSRCRSSRCNRASTSPRTTSCASRTCTTVPNPELPVVREHAVKVLCLAAAASIVVALLWLGAKPYAGQLFPPPWDKLAHVTVYAALAVLLWIGLPTSDPLVVIVTVLMVGVLDELHQAALPGRTADLADIFADACGIGVAFLLLRGWRPAMK